MSGANTNLLAVFDTVVVRNEEKISAEDRDFCQRHQRVLTRTLDQLQRWYDLLRQEADACGDEFKATYKVNGTVEYNSPYSWNRQALDYSEFEFRPFKVLNEVVKLYQGAVQRFGNNIVDYFNKRYNLSVERPAFDSENTPFGQHPAYTDYVNLVITHLGGRGFRETAEQELIDRLHKMISDCYGKLPVVTGNKIVFDRICAYSNIALEFHQRYDIDYDALCKVGKICAALVFHDTGSLNGGTEIIGDFNQADIDITRSYPLSIDAAEGIKFYKNGRLDVIFANHGAAEACYKRLHLDAIQHKY